MEYVYPERIQEGHYDRLPRTEYISETSEVNINDGELVLAVIPENKLENSRVVLKESLCIRGYRLYSKTKMTSKIKSLCWKQPSCTEHEIIF